LNIPLQFLRWRWGEHGAADSPAQVRRPTVVIGRGRRAHSQPHFDHHRDDYDNALKLLVGVVRDSMLTLLQG